MAASSPARNSARLNKIKRPRRATFNYCSSSPSSMRIRRQIKHEKWAVTRRTASKNGAVVGETGREPATAPHRRRRCRRSPSSPLHILRNISIHLHPLHRGRRRYHRGRGRYSRSVRVSTAPPHHRATHPVVAPEDPSSPAASPRPCPLREPPRGMRFRGVARARWVPPRGRGKTDGIYFYAPAPPPRRGSSRSPAETPPI